MKKSMVICAPVTSRSGYGDHARDLVKCFLEHDKYNIVILDVRWGDTPRNALDLNNQSDKRIYDLIKHPSEIKFKPDVYVDIRIPNEFQQLGKFNIGITAGIESDIVSGKWLDGCNKMDLVIVPSKHSKIGFVNSSYDKIQNLANGQQQKVGELKLETPIEVLFEGVDDDVYKPLETKEIDTEFFDWLNVEVPEKFAYLSVGLWGHQPYGEDRKDIGKMIKLFYESFANKKKQPALILKTNMSSFSVMDKENCLRRIKEIKNMFPREWNLPNVYLLHGDLSREELNYLYNHPKTKCMVSFTHGEGFGRPLLEASMVGLPIIASGWSGHTDFINTKDSILLDGSVDKIPASAVWEDILIPESHWFNVDENKAYKAFNYSFSNFQLLKKDASSLMEKNRKKFTWKNMSKEFDKIMEKHLKDVPQQVELNLPKLKQVELNKPDEPKLPKLKKLTEVV